MQEEIGWDAQGRGGITLGYDTRERVCVCADVFHASRKRVKGVLVH
jgi:hypothetical protein